MIAGFTSQDILVVGLVVFLEAILSLDNAVVLAILARHLPPKLQGRALTYGIVGAITFRTLAIFAASTLMNAVWVKFVGGSYLIWLGAKYFFGQGHEGSRAKEGKPRSFWMTVLVIELTDIAFAADSILAAI